MGYPTEEKKTAPWWAIIHVLSVLGQLGLCIVGVVDFINTHPDHFNGHSSSDDEFWDNADDDDDTSLAWGAAGLGGATAVVNIIVFVILHRVYGPNEQVRLMQPINRFKRSVIISSIIFKLIMTGDITLAIKGGKAGKIDICVAGAVGGFCLLLAIVADVHRLRKLKKDKKKNNYIMELGHANEAGMTGPPMAPPPYAAAAGPRY